MKKNILLVYLLIITIACSNSDDVSLNEKGDTGMIKSITDITNLAPHETDGVTNFFYNEGKKLKRIEHQKETVDNVLSNRFLFFYENNNIIRIEAFHKTNNSNINVIHYLEYDDDDNLSKYTRDSDRDGIEIHNYTHLNNGNISHRYKKSNMIDFETKILEFDDEKNLIYDGIYESFTYDDKVSPYFGIIGFDKIYFVEMHLLYVGNFPEYYNNVLGFTHNSFIREYTYEYNTGSKPILRNYNQSNSSFETTYNYY